MQEQTQQEGHSPPPDCGQLLALRESQLAQALEKIALLDELLQQKNIEVRQLHQLNFIDKCSTSYPSPLPAAVTALLHQGAHKLVQLLAGKIRQKTQLSTGQIKFRLQLQRSLEEQSEALRLLSRQNMQKDKQLASLSKRVEQLCERVYSQRQKRCERQVSLGQVAELLIAKLKSTVVRLQDQKLLLQEELSEQRQQSKELRSLLNLRNSSIEQLILELRQRSDSEATTRDRAEREPLGKLSSNEARSPRPRKPAFQVVSRGVR